jgi:oxygen-independent coproporphyrinogen-3 oxidase
MAGIYIHIPFCKSICSYCDFYKTTNTTLIPNYLQALYKELEIRQSYLMDEIVETVYIGGGTPSLLSPAQLAKTFNIIRQFYRLSANCEITLEANPDDLTGAYLKELASGTPINRLSIGIQSFNDTDLLLLNRRHNAAQAISCVQHSQSVGFKNISIDLIYGIPNMDIHQWRKNLEIAFSLDIQHLSAYHLTIENGTALFRKVSNGVLKTVTEEDSIEQYSLMTRMTARNSFIHYEISNMAREGFISRHNFSYWNENKYLGAGPAAHSYDLISRQWNYPQVKKYIEALKNGEEFSEQEALDNKTRYNERLMVSLRTFLGVDAEKILKDFGESFYYGFCKSINPHIALGYIIQEGTVYKMTEKGWLISDYIISDLMQE